MEFNKTPLDGLYVIKHTIISDERGFFARTFCKNEFQSIGFNNEFVQFNHSFNLQKGTLRGMHFQRKPYCETKLIRCLQGSVYDIAIDLRIDSPTFLQYFGVELSAENMTSVLIPEGFAHGFQTLENNCTLIYHHTEFYNANADAGIRHNDEKLGIKWPLPIINVSNKDKSYPLIDKNFKGI
jgi:dTDP-4-dehydrorhamnose 3,5-epimerase